MYQCFISLNEDDFRCLVRGGILQIHDRNNAVIHISLLDIGYDVMNLAITDCANGKEIVYEGRKRDIQAI